MANTTYKSSIKPQFSGVQAQDVSYDLSQPKQMLGEIAKGVEQEAKTLQNIAQDESQINFNRGAAELVEKYGTDYKGLNDALLKLEQGSYDDFRKHNPELAEDLLRQQDAVRLRAVETARKQYVKVNNNKIKTSSGMLLDSFKMAMPDDYANYLDTIRKPAEEQDINIKGQWENNLEQIDELLNRRDMNGNYIFDEKTRKQKQFIQDYMLHGAKNMIDRFVTSNDSAGLQDYYQAHILAPERYMKQTGQDRDTYDKVKKYAEQQLKRMDVEAETLKFKQSVQNAMGLIVEYTPEKMADLRESNILPKRILDDIEKTNVKFNSINPSEPELPTNLLNVVGMINRWEAQPNAETTDEQIQALAEANLVLDEVADYALEYPMSDTDLTTARRMILEKARNQAYGEMMHTFGEITNGFGQEITNVEESVNRIRSGKSPSVDVNTDRSWWEFFGRSRDEKVAESKVRLLTEAIRDCENQTIQALQEGNLAALPKIQRELQVNAAHIKYMDMIDDSDWISWGADKDHIFAVAGHPLFRVKEITPKGDIITEIVK